MSGWDRRPEENCGLVPRLVNILEHRSQNNTLKVLNILDLSRAANKHQGRRFCEIRQAILSPSLSCGCQGLAFVRNQQKKLFVRIGELGNPFVHQGGFHMIYVHLCINLIQHLYRW